MTVACERLAAGDHWPTAPIGSVFVTRGRHFDVSISVLGAGDHAPPPVSRGEEVAAILEGSFDIDAAGEQYRLSQGEVIIIPPEEPREWRCISARGVLYRVVVTPPASAI